MAFVIFWLLPANRSVFYHSTISRRRQFHERALGLSTEGPWWMGDTILPHGTLQGRVKSRLRYLPECLTDSICQIISRGAYNTFGHGPEYYSIHMDTM